MKNLNCGLVTCRVLFASVVALTSFLPGFTRPEDVLLGKPKPAAGTHSDEKLLEKDQYSLGFSANSFEPYWVSWYVGSESMGTAKRKNRFHKESAGEVVSAKPTDYKKTLYQSNHPNWTLDRGHMCPSADRTKTSDDNYETFSMANMVPQVKELNRGPWKNLEEYCRKLVDNGDSLLITAGQYGGGSDKINGKVVIPKHCWKVIVVLPSADAGADQISEDTRVIAVDMPNDPDSMRGKSWTDFICSVDDIERKARYDLLLAVASDVQDSIEATEDGGDDDLE